MGPLFLRLDFKWSSSAFSFLGCCVFVYSSHFMCATLFLNLLVETSAYTHHSHSTHLDFICSFLICGFMPVGWICMFWTNFHCMFWTKIVFVVQALINSGSRSCCCCPGMFWSVLECCGILCSAIAPTSPSHLSSHLSSHSRLKDIYIYCYSETYFTHTQ